MIPGKKPSLLGRFIINSSLAGLQKADCLLPDSGSTMSDLKEVLGVSPDLMRVLFPPITNLNDKRTEVSHEAMKSPYIFHLGHNGDYKNRMGVIQAFSKIKLVNQNKISLVMAGPAPDKKLRDLVETKGLESYVKWVIGPTDDLLSALYADAKLLLFPSIYEGFGWPPLEAMEAGVPVVCSNAASLPEIVGDAALMASHDDYAQLAALCERVLSDCNLRNDLVQKGYENLKRFSFEQFTANLQSVYSSLAPALKESQRPNETVSFAVSVNCEK
jgi:glycosyltransferase involved in cell wall biosynthesis